MSLQVRCSMHNSAKSILMFQILNVIQDFRLCSRRCIGSLSPSPGTPGEGWGEGLSPKQRENALTLTLSRSTGRGDWKDPTSSGTRNPASLSHVLNPKQWIHAVVIALLCGLILSPTLRAQPPATAPSHELNVLAMG